MQHHADRGRGTQQQQHDRRYHDQKRDNRRRCTEQPLRDAHCTFSRALSLADEGLGSPGFSSLIAHDRAHLHRLTGARLLHFTVPNN